jgi:hypothetical protein
LNSPNTVVTKEAPAMETTPAAVVAEEAPKEETNAPAAEAVAEEATPAEAEETEPPAAAYADAPKGGRACRCQSGGTEGGWAMAAASLRSESSERQKEEMGEGVKEEELW